MTSKRETSPSSPADLSKPTVVTANEDATDIVNASDIVDTADVEATPSLEKTPSTGRHWLKYAGIGGQHRSGAEKNAVKTKDEITSLGSLEAELLGIIWEIDHPATGMEIMETTLYKRRARNEEPPAFATIATTLRRLTDKGLLEAYKNETRTPVYRPTVEREQMAARILNNVSVTLLGSTLHGLLPKLMGGLHLKKEDNQSGQAEEQEHLQRLMQALEQVANASDKNASDKTEG